MSKRSPLILRVWPGDFGVPAVDPIGLQLMIMFKMHNVDYDVRPSCLPYWRDIPSIQFPGSDPISLDWDGPNGIKDEFLSYLKIMCNIDIDASSDKYVIRAYKEYFTQTFGRTFLFECWINDCNFEQFTRVWFKNVIPFPFNYFYVQKMRNACNIWLEYSAGPLDRDTFRLQLHKITTGCLADLACHYNNDGEYFFGPKLTTLDLFIYSSLVIALNMPLPDPALQTSIKNHPSLMRFVKNVTQQYFPDVSSELKYVQSVNGNDDHIPTKSLVFAGLCAATGMLLYAYSVGLIKFPSFRLRN